jgi:hypothetical protein
VEKSPAESCFRKLIYAEFAVLGEYGEEEVEMSVFFIIYEHSLTVILPLSLPFFRKLPSLSFHFAIINDETRSRLSTQYQQHSSPPHLITISNTDHLQRLLSRDAWNESLVDTPAG